MATAKMPSSEAALLAAEFLMTQHGMSSRSVSAQFASHITGVSKTSLESKFGDVQAKPPAAPAANNTNDALLTRAEHLMLTHGCSVTRVASVLALSASTLFKRVSRAEIKIKHSKATVTTRARR